MTTVSTFMPSWKDYFLWLFRDSLLRGLFPLLVLAPLGLIIVPIALIFARKPTDVPPEALGSQGDDWEYVRLPKWAYLWDNPQVGVEGDQYWPSRYPGFFHIFGITKKSFFAKWWWLAIRNPISGSDTINSFVLDDKADIFYIGDYAVDSYADWASAGAQFVKCVCNGQSYYGLFWVHQYHLNSKYCFRLRMGFKTKPNVPVNHENPVMNLITTACTPTLLARFGL